MERKYLNRCVVGGGFSRFLCDLLRRISQVVPQWPSLAPFLIFRHKRGMNEASTIFDIRMSNELDHSIRPSHALMGALRDQVLNMFVSFLYFKIHSLQLP